jgi:hypothetical protein
MGLRQAPKCAVGFLGKGKSVTQKAHERAKEGIAYEVFAGRAGTKYATCLRGPRGACGALPRRGKPALPGGG